MSGLGAWTMSFLGISLKGRCVDIHEIRLSNCIAGVYSHVMLLQQLVHRLCVHDVN